MYHLTVVLLILTQHLRDLLIKGSFSVDTFCPMSCFDIFESRLILFWPESSYFYDILLGGCLITWDTDKYLQEVNRGWMTFVPHTLSPRSAEVILQNYYAQKRCSIFLLGSLSQPDTETLKMTKLWWCFQGGESFRDVRTQNIWNSVEFVKTEE